MSQVSSSTSNKQATTMDTAMSQPFGSAGDLGTANKFLRGDDSGHFTGSDSSRSITPALNNLAVVEPPKKTESSPSQPKKQRKLVDPRTYVHPKPFKQVLQYRMEKTLGQGSMGKVKLAVNTLTNEKVAIKIVPRYPVELMRRPGERRRQGEIDVEYDPVRELRILREAFMLKLLSHPNVEKMMDFVVTEDHYYMVFEYIPGRQLLDWIVQHGRMGEDVAKHVMAQMLSSVSYCHRNSIVHRDLKIENVLITDGKSSTPQIKLIDFGLSNFFRPDNLLSTFCGSLYFAAPELLSARRYVGPEVDVWSLGVIAFVLTCGQVPFDDANLSILHAKIKAGRVLYPSHLSAGCVSFMKRMLVVNPKERATIEELLNHPWISSVTKPAPAVVPSEPANDAVPFMMRLAPFLGMASSEKAAESVSPLDAAFEPVVYHNRQPLNKLPGVHPAPEIVALLKRHPEHAADLDCNEQTVQFVTETGHPTFPNDATAQTQLVLSDPMQLGFAHGFGFKAEEVDLVLEQAVKADRYINDHPIMSLYYLIWEWLERNPSTDASVLDRRPSLAPSLASSSSSVGVPPANTIRRRWSEPDAGAAANASASKSANKPGLSVITETTAETMDPDLLTPRNVDIREFASAKDASSLISTKPPFEHFSNIVFILQDEGMTVEGATSASNLLSSLKSRSVHALVEFMRTNRLSNGGQPWSLRCAWHPSLAQESSSVMSAYLRFFNRMQIRFDVELVRIDTGVPAPNPADLERADTDRRYSIREEAAPMYGLQFRRISGDPTTYRRIIERILSRYSTIISTNN